MQSAKRRELMSASILLSTALLASGCASVQPTVIAPSACSSLVGPSLRADVPPVDLPPEDATAGDLWTAFDGQTARLDTANLFKRAQMETVERCEARDQAVTERYQRPWWKLW